MPSTESLSHCIIEGAPSSEKSIRFILYARVRGEGQNLPAAIGEMGGGGGERRDGELGHGEVQLLANA